MALPTKPDCGVTTITGRQVALDINWDTCGDITDPTVLVFKPLGGLQTKGLQRSQETEDGTDDRTVGDYDDMIGTSKTMTLSGNGIMKYTDDAYSNLVLLDDLFDMPGETKVHVRLTEPTRTTYAYMLLSTFNKNYPTKETVKFDLEFSITASGYSVMKRETVAYVEPTGVTVDPATLALSVGGVTALITTIEPTGAPTSVTFESDDESVATVSTTGVVKGVGAGTANITVTSAYASLITGACVVTVT